MLKLKSITETFGKRVYTELGDYFGDVEEAFIQNNKVYGWKIKSTSDSLLKQMVSKAKGVIVPHQLVQAVGDIMIIEKSSIPSYDDKKESFEKEISKKE